LDALRAAQSDPAEAGADAIAVGDAAAEEEELLELLELPPQPASTIANNVSSAPAELTVEKTLFFDIFQTSTSIVIDCSVVLYVRLPFGLFRAMP
jgi:hypothetical protein